jgi:DNA-binding transcriptional ArsR family regulator
MDEEEPLVLRSAAQFKALGHPARHRLVNVLRQRPATLRQLAETLGLAKGTLSYHVRVLREAGLVHLAETRHVRGGTEEYFALVRRGFKVGDADGARFLAGAALAEMLPDRPDGPEHTVLRHLWLSEGEARELAERARALATGPEDGDATRGEAYGLLVSLFRADIPALSADDPAAGPPPG